MRAHAARAITIPTGMPSRAPASAERAGLPRDGGAHISSTETERTQHGEIARPPANTHDERVRQRHDTEQREEPRKHLGERLDLTQLVDLRRRHRSFGRVGPRMAPGVERVEAGKRGGPIDAGPVANRERMKGALSGSEHRERSRGEDGAVGQRVRVGAGREHGLTDDSHRERPARARHGDRAADVPARRVEGVGAQRDLVSRHGRRPATIAGPMSPTIGVTT